jgi:hypothetical protein
MEPGKLLELTASSCFSCLSCILRWSKKKKGGAANGAGKPAIIAGLAENLVFGLWKYLGLKGNVSGWGGEETIGK